ncbi:MAG: NAD-dependent epimerase/dehydratase family protein [Planctomycetota bacterium]|jgi:UDP-glucuronate 4-epimerase
MPTLLVTGIAGFIGSHLAAALQARGHLVVGVDNFDPFYPRDRKQRNLSRLHPERLRLVEADIRDRPTMNDLVARHRPAGIFHLAALAGVRSSLRHPARHAAVNVDGLASVLDAAREHGVARLVFTSSSSVYGDHAPRAFREDDAADTPISPYAATKRSGELLCQAYARTSDLRIGIARLFTTYGPGQRPDLAISRFLGCLAADRPLPIFGDGLSSRDYTYIDDVVAGLLAADAHVRAAGPAYCRTWNLGSGRPVQLQALVEQLGAVAGRRPRLERHPAQPGDARHTAANLDRSRDELGYQPRTSLADGLRRQWEWMLASDAHDLPAAAVV